VDEGPWIRWNGIRRSDRWVWDQVHDADDDNGPVTVTLSAGRHRLTIAHREAGAKLDRLLLAPPTYQPRGPGARPDGAPPSYAQTLPAPAAERTPPMALRSDSTSGAWVGVPDGPGNDAPAGGPGAATWTVSVPAADEYVLWGEISASATNDNSFYVTVGDGEETAWHTPAPGETTDGWVWDPVSALSDDETADPVVYSLDAGRHRIRVRNREDGTHLRRLRLTNVPASGPVFSRP
jgi:hypothetical protein